MSVENIMNKARNQISTSFDLAIEEEKYELGEIIELISCYKKRSIDLNMENLTNEIIFDLFTTIYLAFSGLYRHSYISLRCALELGISLFKFYDNNYSYLLWKSNNYDISWTSLMDEERGVLTNKYLNLFKEGDYSLLIESIKLYYRKCSEYVHGKYQYISPLNEYRINYQKEICKANLKMCKDIVSAMIVLLSIRFKNCTDEHFEVVQNCMKKYEVIL